MSQFDNLRDKAEQQEQEHPEQVENLSDQGLDKAGDAADSATGGRFSDQIDQGQQRGDDAIGGSGGDSSGDESVGGSSGSEEGANSGFDPGSGSTSDMDTGNSESESG